MRDVLSQRWIRTEETYAHENPKRVYYLSMEFLIGRSLANNVMNLLLDPIAHRSSAEKRLDWLGLLEQEPDAGLGNGGLGRLAACFLDSMATMQLPAMGYGLRYEYGMFRQTIEDGWQRERPDNWLRRPDPGKSLARRSVEVKLNCSFEVRDGAFQPSRATVDSDRPAVRSPGRRLRRENDQHPPSLGRGGAATTSTSRTSATAISSVRCREPRGRVAHSRSLSR